MNYIFNKNFLVAASITAASFMHISAQTSDTQPRFRHVARQTSDKTDDRLYSQDAVTGNNIPEDSLRIRSAEEIIEATDVAPDIPTFNRLLAPWVFTEYYPLDKQYRVASPSLQSQLPRLWTLAKLEMKRKTSETLTVLQEEQPADNSDIMAEYRPAWLSNAYQAWQMQNDVMYSMMIDDPSLIEYTYWQLPVPPSLPEEEHGFKGFLKRIFISDVNVNDAIISESDIQKKHWLHVVNGALQFSQAYISDNWYQGGNNYLALLINFVWDVQLNTVWHPDLLLQSTLSYKLGLNSVEDDQYRKYSISQDIFQYNFKFGYKARRNWYYTITAQFKTQLLHNYTKNTQTRIASLLTPGDLNLGLGMTYSKTNAAKTIQFNASIAPISYNLKTAIDPKIDHSLFGISQTAKSVSEIGSNADITLNWKIGKMVTYNTRLFLFTDYDYFLSDWENTLNIQFSKLFSTQVYANLRYDSSADSSIAPHWKKFMLKEILSIGLSYTFSTKQ